MSYSGATAASSLANPPVLMAAAIGGKVNTTSTGGNGMQWWGYNSTHTSTEALAANFFTDAKNLGMRKGDLVFMQSCTGTTVNLVIGVLGAVSSDGAAIASTGAIITSTFG
jgi:hypothetical protein